MTSSNQSDQVAKLRLARYPLWGTIILAAILLVRLPFAGQENGAVAVAKTQQLIEQKEAANVDPQVDLIARNTLPNETPAIPPVRRRQSSLEARPAVIPSRERATSSEATNTNPEVEADQGPITGTSDVAAAEIAQVVEAPPTSAARQVPARGVAAAGVPDSQVTNKEPQNSTSGDLAHLLFTAPTDSVAEQLASEPKDLVETGPSSHESSPAEVVAISERTDRNATKTPTKPTDQEQLAAPVSASLASQESPGDSHRSGDRRDDQGLTQPMQQTADEVTANDIDVQRGDSSEVPPDSASSEEITVLSEAEAARWGRSLTLPDPSQTDSTASEPTNQQEKLHPQESSAQAADTQLEASESFALDEAAALVQPSDSAAETKSAETQASEPQAEHEAVGQQSFDAATQDDAGEPTSSDVNIGSQEDETSPSDTDAQDHPFELKSSDVETLDDIDEQETSKPERVGSHDAVTPAGSPAGGVADELTKTKGTSREALSAISSNSKVDRAQNGSVDLAPGALVILNPKTTGYQVSYFLNEQIHRLAPGQSQRRNATTTGSWTIRFDRGGSFGEIEYSLKPGNYVFGVTSKGWQIYRKPAPRHTPSSSTPRASAAPEAD